MTPPYNPMSPHCTHILTFLNNVSSLKLDLIWTTVYSAPSACCMPLLCLSENAIICGGGLSLCVVVATQTPLAVIIALLCRLDSFCLSAVLFWCLLLRAIAAPQEADVSSAAQGGALVDGGGCREQHHPHSCCCVVVTPKSTTYPSSLLPVYGLSCSCFSIWWTEFLAVGWCALTQYII